MAKKIKDSSPSSLNESEKRFVMDIAMNDGQVPKDDKPQERTLADKKEPIKKSKKLKLWGIVAAAAVVLLFVVVSLAIKTRGPKVLYKIGDVSITEQQIKLLSQDIAANKTKDLVNPNNLTDEQYATQQLILHAALIREGKRAGLDVSEVGLDKLLENEYKTKGGNKQAYREKLLMQKLRPEPIFIYKENEALKSKLADGLIQTKELFMTFSRWDSIPEDVRPAAEQKARKLLTTKFLPLYTNGTPAEEIAKLADINPYKSREENDKLVKSQMTANPPTNAGTMKYNAESSNFIDYDNTSETKETISANKKVSELKKKGDVTGVFRSRSGMNIVIRLEKDPVGKYSSWDDMVKSYEKSSKVYLLSNSLRSAVISLKTQKVYASHPGNWGGDHTGASGACTNHNINYLITLRDDATGAWINNAGINVSNRGRCPYSYQENLAASGLAGVGYNYFIQINCNGSGWKWDFNIPGYFNTPSGFSSSAGGGALSGSSYLPPFGAGVGNGALLSVDITFTHVPPPPPPPAYGWAQFIPKVADPPYSSKNIYNGEDCLVGGWAVDSASPTAKLQVDVYWDYSAADPRRTPPNTIWGSQYWPGVATDPIIKNLGPGPDDQVGDGGHGFFTVVPAKYRDNSEHLAYVYAHRADTSSFELNYNTAANYNPGVKPVRFVCSPPSPKYYPWLQTKQGNVVSQNTIKGQQTGSNGGRDSSSASKEADFVVISKVSGSNFCSSNAYAFGVNQRLSGNCDVGKYELNDEYVDANNVVSNVTSITTDGCGPGSRNPKIGSLSASAAVPGPDVSLGCVNGMVWKFPTGNATLTGGSYNKGRATIYAEGDLRITSNIIASSAAAYEGEFVPNLGIFAKGDIIIDEGVSRIDASIFATGTIKTCGDKYNDVITPKCTGKLEVHGLLASNNAAKSFEFGRRYTDTSGSPGGPAELIIYQGKVLGFPPPGFTVTRNHQKSKIKYESGLPPRF